MIRISNIFYKTNTKTMNANVIQNNMNLYAIFTQKKCNQLCVDILCSCAA